MTEFPRLMWTKDGREVTVQSADEKAAVLKDGGRLTLEPAPEAEDEPKPAAKGKK